MDSFPVLPMNKFLYQIAIKVLGEYAKWLKKHPEYIPRAIQFTMASLNGRLKILLHFPFLEIRYST
jgi:hypothetical protein